MNFPRVITVLLVSLPIICTSQTLKELDFASIYEQAGVSSQTVMKERENGAECKEQVNQFDEHGRITERIKYFACGKEYSIETFSYDGDGNLERCTYGQVFMQFRELEFELVYNDKGQLIERSLPEAIPQGWQKETMEYDGHGTLVSCKQWIQKDGEWVVYTQQSFLDEVMEMEFRAKNTLTNVFNLEGLPLVHYSRDGNGEVLATTRYIYTTIPKSPYASNN